MLTFSRIFMALIVKRLFYKVLMRNKGVQIMQEDWDNLVILDACRYDMFEKLNNIEGKLEHRVSRGSSTTEFMLRNFQGNAFKDTVYVTANPLVNYDVPKSFLKIVPVWKYGWDEGLGTVLPETMLEYAGPLHLPKIFVECCSGWWMNYGKWFARHNEG